MVEESVSIDSHYFLGEFLIMTQERSSQSDANCEKELRNMQIYFSKLIESIRPEAKNTDEEFTTLIKASQQRLMTFKELQLHYLLINDEERIDAFDAMTKAEQAIALLGLPALTYAIDQIDKLTIAESRHTL